MGNADSNPFRLHVLGAPDLRAPDGRRVVSVLSQPKRLALLTYLALAPEPVTRARVCALFWPEAGEDRARNALSQAVFYLRRSLADRVVESFEGDRLWAPPEHVWCDARDDASATGELLDGWNADDGQELQEWLDAERRRIRRRGAADADLPGTAPDEAVAAPASARAGPMPSATPAAPDGEPPLPAPAHRTRPRPRALLGPALIAALAGAALALTLTLSGNGAQGVEAPATGTLAVLMPRISAAPGAPALDPGALHAEVLAALPHVDGVRLVSASYAGSLLDLRRQLAALGVEGSEEPRWILELSIRLTRDEARGVALLHRTPAYDLPGRASFDVTWESAEAALLHAPEEVARAVADMVADALSAGSR